MVYEVVTLCDLGTRWSGPQPMRKYLVFFSPSSVFWKRVDTLNEPLIGKVSCPSLIDRYMTPWHWEHLKINSMPTPAFQQSLYLPSAENTHYHSDANRKNALKLSIMTKANSNGASKIVIKSDFNGNAVKPTPTKLANYHFVEDFGIVWKNVTVFGLGHLLYLYACYDAIVNYSPTLNFWSE